MRIIVVLLNIIISLCAIRGSSFAQTQKALLIGISDYGCPSNQRDSVWTNIHGANDVLLLEATLAKHGFQTTIITDQAATANNIRTAMKRFLNDANLGNTIFFHFSGHGQPFEDSSGDEEDGWDEAIIPIDTEMIYGVNAYQGENHILDDELNAFFQNLRIKIGPEGQLCVILDACHMGTAYRGEENEEIYIRGTRNAFTPNGKLFIPRIDTRSNIQLDSAPTLAKVFVLEACRSYQVNNEIKEGGTYYGPLSYYFNKHLLDNNLCQVNLWLSQVIDDMRKDIRLIRQNPVVESSEPFE